VLTFRTVKANDVANQLALASSKNPYIPFYETENEAYASVNFPALKGYFSLIGSYTEPKFFPKTYSAGLEYTRAFGLTRFGTAQLSAQATTSNIDSRIGFTLTFFRKLNAHTDVSYGVGAEAVEANDKSAARTGVAPVLTGTIDHTDVIKGVDVTESADVSSDSQEQAAQGRILASSDYGIGDLRVNYDHNQSQSDTIDVTLNGATGFAYGGGAWKLGLRTPGDSMVIVSVDKQAASDVPPDAATLTGDGAGVAAMSTARSGEGGYRAVINDQPYGLITVGQSQAIGLQSYDNYRVSLTPDGAPSYSIDLAAKTVSLYPGNVAHLRWGAVRLVTAFGQLLDGAGKPIVRARVSADTDVTMTDDQGYFTVTAPPEATMTIDNPDGSACVSTSITAQIDHNVSHDLVRLKPQVCTVKPAH
jgi:hypothetical protein